MEIVTEEHAASALRVVARYRGCSRKDLLTIGRQRYNGFDRPHHGGHAIHVRSVDKDGPRGEQMRATLTHERLEVGRGKRLRQSLVVQAGAEALAVQALHHGRHTMPTWRRPWFWPRR